MTIEINECGAPILIECEDCGSRFFDNEEHTPQDCAKAQGLAPERDEESARIERIHDEE